MKVVFIAYNQALTEAMDSVLDRNHIRGYTKWTDVQGRGTYKGEPHLGSHIWPSMNSAIITFIEEEKIEPLMESLNKLDTKAEQQGLRAFVWNVERMI